MKAPNLILLFASAVAAETEEIRNLWVERIRLAIMNRSANVSVKRKREMKDALDERFSLSCTSLCRCILDLDRVKRG